MEKLEDEEGENRRIRGSENTWCLREILMYIFVLWYTLMWEIFAVESQKPRN